MKKLIWLILLCSSVMTVKASEIYYGDYKEFSAFTPNEILADDVTNVVVEERYLWYKEKNILGDYKLYNLQEQFSDDCYYSDFSSWSNNKIDNEGYIYEQRTKYNYTLSDVVRYIHLYNLQGSYDAFRITELIVNVAGKSIDYQYICDGCWEDFDKYINNGIYDENKSYIDNGGSLIIDLGKNYPIHQIEVIFYLFDLGPSDKLYTVGYSKDKKNIYLSQNFKLKFADEYWKNAKKIRFNIFDLDISQTEWTNNEVSYELRTDNYVLGSQTSLEYRYKEKWCRPLTITREYYEDYSKDSVADYIYKDINTKTLFYSYQLRDKLELEIYEINENNFDLNNFVVFATDQVLIEDDIDWSKNGYYNVKFILNDLIVDKEIVVNLDENTIKDLNDEINTLKEQLENLKEEFDENKKNYEEIISDLNNKLNDCNFNNECLNQVILEKEQIIKDYEDKIVYLSNLINELQVKLSSKISQIDDLTNVNATLNNEIFDLEKELHDLKNSSLKLNKDLVENYGVVNKLKNLINFYENKIKELEEDIRKMNTDISNTLLEKDELISKYVNQVKILESKLNNGCLEVTTDLNLEKESNRELNNKLDGYVLKINNGRIINLILIIILILVLLLFLIMKCLKKATKK